MNYGRFFLLATALLSTTAAHDARIELLSPSVQFPMQPSMLIVYDIDDDGDIDLVQLPSHGLGGGYDAHAYWMENLGKRRFAPPRLCHIAPVRADQWLEHPTFADLCGSAGAEIFVSRKSGSPASLSHEPLALTLSLDGPAPADGRVLAPASPWPWTAVDLDGDGPAELIQIGRNEDDAMFLRVWERNGTDDYAEVLTQPLPPPDNTMPEARIETLDLDGDGDLDLTFQNPCGSMLILERTGRRAFALNLKRVGEPSSDRWIDVDGDSLPDLLTGDGAWCKNRGGLDFSAPSEMTAWKEVFANPWFDIFPQGGGTAVFHTIAKNAAGRLVLATYPVDSTQATREQMLPVDTSAYPWVFCYEDLDRDGQRDLLFRTGRADGGTTLEVLWGSARKSKVPARLFTAPPRHQSIFAGDFDRDGRDDLIIGPNASGRFHIRRAGRPSAVIQSLKLRRHSVEVVQVGDADGDGLLDLICRCIPHQTADGRALLAVARGNGKGRFARPKLPRLSASWGVFGGEWVDWDLDGSPDLVGQGVLQESRRGRFSVPPRPLIALYTTADFIGNPVTIGFTRTGDLDGDGIPDIVSAVYGDPEPHPPGLIGDPYPVTAGIGYGDGAGGIAETVLIQAKIAASDFLGNPTVIGDLALADLDLDGDIDIYIREIIGSDFLGNPLVGSHWLENPGDGSRNPSAWTPHPLLGDISPAGPQVDFDGDGSLEWVGLTGYLKAATGGPQERIGHHFTGDAEFFLSPLRIAGDFDGDGVADYIVGGNGMPLLLIHGIRASE